MDHSFRIINIYVPTGGSERIDFLPTLDRFLDTKSHIILGGEFNCLLDLNLDKREGNHLWEELMVPN